MQGLILAAGMGKRLGSLTKNNTKCMVNVNGEPLIKRTLELLDKRNLNRIVLVVGYARDILVEYVSTLSISTPIEYVVNDDYATSNNIFSLSLAKHYLLEDDTILLESDIIFEDSVLDALLDDKRETLALVDKYDSWMDGTCLKLDDNDNIIDFISKEKFDFNDSDKYYKTVNIYKFSKEFANTHYVPFLNAYCMALGNNEYYEQVLQVISMLKEPMIKAKRLFGQKWYEIDDIQDLDIAESLFTWNNNSMCARYGGYWRYSDLLDFCYLVNPYFPPPKLISEMKASFTDLLIQYPSGRQCNDLLASRNFNVDKNRIIVGNGAAELINHLMTYFDGNIGIIRPTFEEYSNRYNCERQIVFTPNNLSFSYSVDDLIQFFTGKNLQALFIINPDNPSGHYICKADLIRLVKWCNHRNIMLIVDESFVDFADVEFGSILSDDVLSDNENLIVIKSISKSHGVPGLRLGILATADVACVDYIRSKISIWNINSFGEFYMQIFGKYETDYKLALKKFSVSRRNFIQALSKFDALRVIPSQANFLLIELLDMSADELSDILLKEYNILIKNLSSKINCGEFIRVAVKNEQDNDAFISALTQIFTSTRCKNRWYDIWNNRCADIDVWPEDEFSLYSELKRLDGFDVQVSDTNAYYTNFYESILNVYESHMSDCDSVFEVGCGSGANLLLFQNRNKSIGGIDYSEKLVNIANKVLDAEVHIDEAINMPTDEKYDVVISDSVFAYFSDEQYGMNVLRKMYDKSNSKIILLEIFDKDYEEECVNYRRSVEDDYDEKYNGLHKVFYPKSLFIRFAKEHDCDIVFTSVENDEYWNSHYMYNCIMTKRSKT